MEVHPVLVYAVIQSREHKPQDISIISHHKYQNYAASAAFLSFSTVSPWTAYYWIPRWAHFHRTIQLKHIWKNTAFHWMQVPDPALIYYTAGTASFIRCDRKQTLFFPSNRHQSNNIRRSFQLSSTHRWCRFAFFPSRETLAAHRTSQVEFSS